MPISKHNKTQRGTQKQRARVHDKYLMETFPKIFGHLEAPVETLEAPVEEVQEAPVVTQ